MKKIILLNMLFLFIINECLQPEVYLRAALLDKNFALAESIGANFNDLASIIEKNSDIRSLIEDEYDDIKDFLDKSAAKKSGGGVTQEQVNKMIKDAGFQPVSVSNKADALKELKEFFTKKDKPGKQLLEVIANDKKTIEAVEKAFKDLQ